MDIFDLSRYADKNDNYRYILVCIDVFSRRAYVEKLKDKTPEEVSRAFDEILKRARDKPRSILSDQEGSFLSKLFEAKLDSYKIPLNTNATGDHHALGIIDNFAKRIKAILTATFLKYNTTRWIDDIQRIVSHYNDTQHSALEHLTPNQAMNKENEARIENLNVVKNMVNKTVSDLQPGDKVRKDILFNAKNYKGTDPRWSDEVFNVKSVHGKTVLLSDDMKFKRNNLLKVPPNTVSNEPNIINQKESCRPCCSLQI